MGLHHLCGALAAIALTAFGPAALAQSVAEAGAAEAVPAAEIFSAITVPVAGSAVVHGRTNRGCIEGAVTLADEGPHWQTMRPSRNRFHGHPETVALIESIAAEAPALGLRGLLVGDLSQPAGGPMPYGHRSHQSGLDADIWFTEMPETPFTVEERETVELGSMLTEDGGGIDSEVFTPPLFRLVKAVADAPAVQRIFVNPHIKQALCDWDGAADDRRWLRKVRPWFGHDAHFHIRLRCPADMASCENQQPPPLGDGCGAELQGWFKPVSETPPPKTTKKSAPITIADLPAACRRIAQSAGVLP